MFTLINEELFISQIKELTNKEGTPYYKETISTVGDDEGKSRKLLISTASDKDVLVNSDSVASISTKENINQNGKSTTNVLVRLSDTEQKYSQPVLVVAYPFNGVFVPQDENPDYRIYKAMVSTMKDKSQAYSFNGRMYRKIAYVVIGLNVNKLKEADDKVTVRFESYNFTKGETGEKVTNMHSLQIEVVPGDDALSYKYEYRMNDEIVEPVDIEELTAGKPMFKVFTPKTKAQYKKPNDGNKRVSTDDGKRNSGRPQSRGGRRFKSDNSPTVYSDSKNDSGNKAFENLLKSYQNQFDDNQSSIKSRNKKKTGKRGRR